MIDVFERGLELDEAYEQLYSKLRDHSPALSVFFDQLQSTAAFWSPEASLGDSFKAFFVALEKSSARNHGFLPNTFEVSDRSMASLMSCALGLGPDEIVDSGYVKRLRQRQREQVRQN